MYLTVTYDITLTKARNKIVNLLDSYGFRVQKSVYEIQLNQKQFKILKKQMNRILKWAKTQYSEEHENIDGITFYVLSKIWEGSVEGRIDGLGEGFESVYFDDVLIM